MNITKIADMEQGIAFAARTESEDLVSAAIVDWRDLGYDLVISPTYEVNSQDDAPDLHGAKVSDEDGTRRVWLSWANPGVDRKVWMDDEVACDYCDGIVEDVVCTKCGYDYTGLYKD